MGGFPRIAAGVAMVTMLGCRPYHMYGGEFRSDAEVGTVTQAFAARMMTVDGGDTGISSVLKLLPGPHTIEVEAYEVGYDTKLDQYTRGSANRMEGKFRWYVCTCALRLDVVAGQSYELDGGEVEAGKWSVWAAPPDRGRPEHSWSAVAPLDPPRCLCEGKARSR